MFCYKCGKEIHDESKFCAYCGTKSPFFTEEKIVEEKRFCNECRIYSEGDFCKKCGKRTSKEKADFQKNVISFFVGVTVLVAGILSFVSSFFTILSDLSAVEYWDNGYRYIAPLTPHESTNIFLVFMGIICILVGVIMVASNKLEATCVNRAYEPIAYIAYAATVVLVLFSIASAIPYFSICSKCGTPTFGETFKRVGMCNSCYEDSWD